MNNPYEVSIITGDSNQHMECKVDSMTEARNRMRTWLVDYVESKKGSGYTVPMAQIIYNHKWVVLLKIQKVEEVTFVWITEKWWTISCNGEFYSLNDAQKQAAPHDKVYAVNCETRMVNSVVTSENRSKELVSA